MILKRKIVFIINPIAGKGASSTLPAVIEQTIDHLSFDLQIQTSNEPGDIEKLTLDAIKNGAEIIVAAGGDGTVNEIAKHLVHTSIALGIIPTGSGNGLGNFLKIPHDLKKAVEKINQLNFRIIDTGSINGHFFVSVAGIGFDASVAKSYAQSNTRGFKTYFHSAFKKYFSYKPAKYKIKFNNNLIARRALLITFANTDQFGYNTSIAPLASIDDGLLDMCIMKKVPLIAAPVVIPKLFTRRIHTSRFHESYLVQEATVFRKRLSVIQIDGEPIRMKEKVIRVVCNKQSLKVLA